MKRILMGLILVGLVGTIEAADIYVPTDYGNIQAAIDAATTGSVWVARFLILFGHRGENKMVIVLFEKCVKRR